jgi:hypothetical protein
MSGSENGKINLFVHYGLLVLSGKRLMKIRAKKKRSPLPAALFF